ncbi:MAG: hypothetical protein SVR94_00400 [Pseudomonadota bacterium]|nr:hypothetical protein [Pseudomonadota bacterium]
MSGIEIKLDTLPELLEKWQQQKGISRTQALKVAELAVELLNTNKDLSEEKQLLWDQYFKLEDDVSKLKLLNKTLEREKDELQHKNTRIKEIEDKHRKLKTGGTLTFRWEKMKNGYSDKLYGPYLVVYFRAGGKLRKKYLGKSEPNERQLETIREEVNKTLD